MIETKPLEVIVQVERIYNVQETIADMKAMGGQVAEYALVMEKLCDIIKRQEKEFRALNEDLGAAEAKVMKLKAEVDTLKTRMKALVECDGESECPECFESDDDEYCVGCKYCAGCKYRRMCELISVNEGEKNE